MSSDKLRIFMNTHCVKNNVIMSEENKGVDIKYIRNFIMTSTNYS